MSSNPRLLELLRLANIARTKEYLVDGDGNPVELDPNFRALELLGEKGEVFNELKKLQRHKLGLAGGKSTTDDLAEELADVVISIDEIAMDHGINLRKAIVDKFNKTSTKLDLETKMEPPC